jgi:hypothetical protein
LKVKYVNEHRWTVQSATRSYARRDGGLRREGPFTQTDGLIAGYWLIQVKSEGEAIEWAKRAPAPHGEEAESEIEIRQLFELEDFAPSKVMIARASWRRSWQIISSQTELINY